MLYKFINQTHYICAIFFLLLNKVFNGHDFCKKSFCGNHGQCVSLENTLKHSSLTYHKNLNKSVICHCDSNWYGEKCDTFVCSGRSRSRMLSLFGVLKPGPNHYSDNSQCAWLIGNGDKNVPIRLSLSRLSIECSWDNLYIHEGSSIQSPLVAVFNGYLTQDAITTWPELLLHSGYVYLYFSSDFAYNLSGFTLSYSLSNCSLACESSSHGRCDSSGMCQCEEGWEGDSCMQPSCPHNCSHPNGLCVNSSCHCLSEFSGKGCDIRNNDGYWREIFHFSFPSTSSASTFLSSPPSSSSLTSSVPPHLTSAKSLVVNNKLYLIGGYSFKQPKDLVVYTSDMQEVSMGFSVLDTSASASTPLARFKHAVAAWQDKIFMFGGMLLNNTIVAELWCLHLSNNTWSLVTSSDQSNPLPVEGHTGHIYNKAIYILFGHNYHYGFLHYVQKFDLVTRCWSLLETKGARPPGLFGHSSVLETTSSTSTPHRPPGNNSSDRSSSKRETASNRVIVMGGLRATSLIYTELLNDRFYYLDLQTLTWTAVEWKGQGRYLHTSVLIGRSIFTYGGNCVTSTPSNTLEPVCHSSQLIIYHLDCQTWSTLKGPDPASTPFNSRHGHSSFVFNNSMYVHGGFNGFVLNDLLVFHPAVCGGSNQSKCLSGLQNGAVCVYLKSGKGGRCLSLEEYRDTEEHREVMLPSDCSLTSQHSLTAKECALYENCQSCVQKGCVMCNDVCQLPNEKCPSMSALKSVSECLQEPGVCNTSCHQLLTCSLCSIQPLCHWKNKKCVCLDKRLVFAVNERHSIHHLPSHPRDFNADLLLTSVTRRLEKRCEKSCHDHKDCSNCTRNSCMWCSSSQRCLDSYTYLAVYPYGRCVEWLTDWSECYVHECGELKGCSACIATPSCGFCDDGSNTGSGTCHPGSLEGASIDSSANGTEACDSKDWHFMRCPVCQCNGYSQCYANTSICISCQNFTAGKQCERCIEGSYGHPVRGIKCQPCLCDPEATEACNSRTGECYCKTKGAEKDCSECANDHRRIYNDCYQVMYLNFMVNFNITNRYTSRLNFFFNASLVDRDIEINITCTPATNVTMVLRKGTQNHTLLDKKVVAWLARRVSRHELQADGNILVHVTDITWPFSVEVSYYHVDRLDLYKFFITFFSCFFTLLLIAFALWKFRQRIDVMRRTQQQMQEMEEMAKRPCSTCLLLVDDNSSHQSAMDSLMVLNAMDKSETKLLSNKHKKHSKFVAVALEPLCNSKAAIMSIIIRLPHVDHPHTLPSQSGLAIGSTLVNMGHQVRKNNDKQVRKKPLCDVSVEAHLV